MASDDSFSNMGLQCQPSMTAADMISSNQIFVTTASGSRTTTIAVQDSFSDFEFSNARTPLSSKARPFSGPFTPLSSKARPFISSQSPWVDCNEEIVHFAMPFGMQQDVVETPTYKVALQEHICLANAQELSAKSGTPSEEVSTTDEVSSISSDVQTEEKASSGSESPTPVASRRAKKHKQSPPQTLLTERVPVKNTFIHFTFGEHLEEDTENLPFFSSSQTGRSRSAPRVLMRNNFTAYPFSRAMATRHLRQDCQPCAYIHNKIDGCRWGLDCKFCHLCPSYELKKRKKQRVKALKEERENESK